MPAGFTASLAARLDHLSQITIKEAQDGDIAKNGVAYIAPGGMNMSLHDQGGHSSLGCPLKTRKAGTNHLLTIYLNPSAA